MRLNSVEHGVGAHVQKQTNYKCVLFEPFS